MDEQRQQAYLNLIQALLICPNGEEPAILKANQDLIDEGLVQRMKAVATMMAEKGNTNAAQFLQRWATQLTALIDSTPTAQDYYSFLMQVLEATAKSNGNPQVVYPLLEANLDKLDDNFIQLFQAWATEKLATVESKQADLIAMMIFNFSELIQEFHLGRRALNIDIAITGYQSMLLVYTRDAFPVDWAMTQYYLGITYHERIQGDRVQNLESAIDTFQQALSVYTRDAFPVDWARTQYNLGIAYHERIQGNKAQNLESAIDTFQQALSVRTRDAFPVDWAMTQNYLAIAYSDRIRGDKAQNLESVIDAFQQALSVYTRDAFPVDWARTQYNLGIAYSNRIQGNKAQNLESAIDTFQQALSVRTRDAFPVDWAVTQTNLGFAYSNRIQGNKAQNLESVIDAFQQALSVYTRDAFPVDWARTQYNLGIAYSNRIQGNKAQNLESAIDTFQQALSVRTRDAFPVDWSRTQYSLGNAYLYRIQGNRAQNLESAINAYQQALSVYTRDAFPYDWAGTQNNLGLAYSNRIQGDKAQNLELAIDVYQQALSVRTRDAFPYDWAGTQNNLGIAYSDRIRGDKAQNLELAIDVYQQALSVRTRDAFPYDWAGTQNNLGIAYSNRIQGNKAQNLESAIDAFQQALSVRTRYTFPIDWAVTQHGLGDAYSNRIQGDKAQNLESAIDAFQQTLSVYTRDAFPYDWARTQHGLGNAYAKIRGDKAQNLESAIARSAVPEAIAAYKKALEIHTPTTLPLNCFHTGSNLGYTAFKEGLWTTAIEGYEQAIAAVELTRTWATSDARRQEILTQAIAVYQNLVQALINTEQLDKAIKYVESSRSRQLVDLMASNDLYANGEIPPEVKEYLQQFENLQQQINQEQKQLDNQSDNNKEQERTVETFHETSRQHRVAFGARTKKIQSLEEEKQKVWEQLRRLDPVLAGQVKVDALDFTTIQQLIDSPKTAILSFYTTRNDTHIFILRKNESPQLHTCSGQGGEIFQNWIFDNWLISYFQDKAVWVSQMNTFLQELASRLRINELIAQHLEDIEEIILIPHLALHQIPFTALPVNFSQSPLSAGEQGRFLGDRFLIRYAPSCQILEFCHKRENQQTLHETSLQYGIVENATDDLYFTTFKCEKIALLNPNHKRLQGSQQATVSNYQKLAKQVQGIHSSHHAHSRWDNPLESQLSLGDGSITLGDLMSPAWRLPQLLEVFLSCCETNFGVSKITDDILTLSSGFLCAGARSVINTLWAVDDLATALFSIFYYEFRQEGYSRAEAVRQAQVKLRTLSGEALKNEYKEELDLMRKMKMQQINSERKALEKQLNLVQGTPAYQELENKYKQVQDIQMKLGEMTNTLASLYQQALPFAHLRYWAAFTCQGMR